ncbi:dihydrolipoamide dehydrogenase [Pseudomonas aeruginosa]|nr:dihydrolipoamide dehydrogenase [Pseudomonas aeruginosa]
MSQILKTSLLIVGGGPGGYVAAIRAGQLGIPTVLVEGAALGGTCLNVGCIPSKALIHAAEEYLKARHYAGRSALGIQVQAPSIDIARTVEWKDAIVDRLTSGVAALLKKHGVDVVQGLGEDPRRQKRGGRTRRRRQPAHRVRAPAAGRRLAERRATDPAAGRQGDLLHRGAGARQPAQTPGGGRRRLHRPGAGYRLPQARRRGGGGGSATAHPAGLRRRTDPSRWPRPCASWASSCTSGTACWSRARTACGSATAPARSARSPPTRYWWRSAASRAAKAGTWKAWAWT